MKLLQRLVFSFSNSCNDRMVYILLIAGMTVAMMAVMIAGVTAERTHVLFCWAWMDLVGFGQI